MLRKLFCALLALMLTAGCALAQTEVSGLTWESELPVEYADQFTVDFYEGGYALIQIVDGGAFLLVPEGMDAPDGLSADVCVLKKPIDRMYLAATSAMALIDAVDGLGSVRLSSVDKSGWYVENAVTAMEKGDILFGGKYSEPDYELMVSEGCDLAVESTMIYHSPKVKEMIELLGIPVLVDSSSRESHPLGRSEWMKLYGCWIAWTRPRRRSRSRRPSCAIWRALKTPERPWPSSSSIPRARWWCARPATTCPR